MSLSQQPLSERFEGEVLRLDGVLLLSSLAQAPGEVLAGGALILRYGIVCLEMPQLSIVPQLVVLEYGEQLEGEAAWDFLLHHSNLHPRAEVHGRRDDGEVDQLRVSRLDLAQQPRVLVWHESETEAAMPLARPQAVLCAEPEALPPRLQHYLPCFASPTDWRDGRD